MLNILWDVQGYEDFAGEAEKERLKSLFEFVMAQEGLRGDYEVSLSVTDKEEIRQVNCEHRGIDAVTDVLSFPMYERRDLDRIEEKKEYELYEVSIGDILICADKIREQAQEFGHSLEREFCYLAVHSILHLLGYDHMEEEDKRRMRQREELVMKEFEIER
ncbi:rRNA maturation RNase YbeY [Filifactor villosus]|uniref:Endoribonuclease YbeY n=1 Tax=Filifactor villosus TaxID=29374 RepID=A0ABV9QL80_9FIRM